MSSDRLMKIIVRTHEVGNNIHWYSKCLCPFDFAYCLPRFENVTPEVFSVDQKVN